MKRTVLILIAIATVLASHIAAQSGHALFQQALSKEQAEGKLLEAIALYQRISKDFPSDRALTAQAWIRLAECYHKLGDPQARAVYERVVKEFSEQPQAVAVATARLEAIGSAGPAAQTARRLAVLHDIDYPAISPDGHLLTYRSAKTGELVVVDLKTEAVRRLTPSQADAQAGPSAVSPDSQDIAYAWRSEAAGFADRADVRVLPLKQTESLALPRVIHRRSAGEREMHPYAWMPDRSALLVVRILEDRTQQIALVSTRDGSVRVLKSLGWWYPHLALSPDGQYVAYDVASSDPGHRAIVVLAIDGSRETPLVQSPADDSEPRWTRDGSEILFRSDRTGSRGLWRMAVVAGRPNGQAQLVKAEFAGRPLGMTSSGALQSLSWSGGENVYLADTAGDSAANKTPVVQGERSINANFGPAWSPDGRHLAYYSSRPSNRTVLVVRTPETGEEREIALEVPVTGGAAFANAPVWFPDGRAILVVGGTQVRVGGKGYYRLDLRTGALELLVHPRAFGPPIYRPAISVDGRTLFYPDFENQPPTRRLVQYDLDRKQETELGQAPQGSYFRTLALSPDGRSLAYLLGDDAGTSATLYVTPLGGGEAHEILRSTPARVTHVAWASDQQHLLFAGADSDAPRSQRVSVWTIPVDGGQPQKTGLSFDALHLFSIAPDGRHVAFDAFTPSSAEVWTLENFLTPRGVTTPANR